MRKSLSSIWRRMCFPLMIALGTLPLPVMIAAFSAPKVLPFVWIWAVAYCILDSVSTAIHGKWRLLYAVAEIAVLLGLTVLMGTQTDHIGVYAIPILYLVVLLSELPRSMERKSEQSHFLIYGVSGIVLHLIGQLVLIRNEIAPQPVAASWLLAGFFLLILVGLIIMNQSNLAVISSGRLHVSWIMKRRNLVLTLLLFGLAVAIVFIPSVVSAVTQLLKWIFAVIMYLITVPSEEGEGGSQVDTSDSSEMNILGDTFEARVRAPWVNTAVIVIAIILATAFVIFVGYNVGRKLIQLYKFLRKALRKYMHAASEDYVDEISDTRDDDIGERQKKKQKKLSGKDVRDLTPQQQIRYRYWLLMRRHPEWSRGSTARENLNAAAATVYERARYSGNPVDEAAARRFAEETKKV